VDHDTPLRSQSNIVDHYGQKEWTYIKVRIVHSDEEENDPQIQSNYQSDTEGDNMVPDNHESGQNRHINFSIEGSPNLIHLPSNFSHSIEKPYEINPDIIR
jgi:hypothetical protein